jgi:hypothetical protein
MYNILTPFAWIRINNAIRICPNGKNGINLTYTGTIKGDAVFM